MSPRARGLMAMASLGVALSGCGLVWGITDLSVADRSVADAGVHDAGAPSCDGLVTRCGTQVGDCCESPLVEGGTFFRSYDGAQYPNRDAPATIGDYRLDRYEITVGRFRAFLAHYPAIPSPGAGKNPRDSSDTGWDPSFASYLPQDAASLASALACAPNATWTDKPDRNEAVAVNCITWYEAYAFCIWDGARLPTEAEWNYAAAGGAEQRALPWSEPPSSSATDGRHAVYGGLPNVANVGSVPLGDGRWGQSDLAGNLWEWNLDAYDDAYTKPCTDCAMGGTSGDRAVRGGCFGCAASQLFVSYRGSSAPGRRRPDVGARCARSQ